MIPPLKIARPESIGLTFNCRFYNVYESIWHIAKCNVESCWPFAHLVSAPFLLIKCIIFVYLANRTQRRVKESKHTKSPKASDKCFIWPFAFTSNFMCFLPVCKTHFKVQCRNPAMAHHALFSAPRLSSTTCWLRSGCSWSNHEREKGLMVESLSLTFIRKM